MPKPAAEEVVKTHLERQGCRVHLSRLQQKSLQRGKWRDRITALLPHYRFVQLGAALKSLAPIRSISIASVVHFGIDFADVLDKIVINLQASEDPDIRVLGFRVCG